MTKNTNTTEEDIRVSMASIYSDLLEKRRLEREAREEKKQQEREAKLKAKVENNSNDDDIKKTKKEKRAAEIDNWKEVIIGLTGDDLEYSEPKKKKKKYSKWIDDEDGQNTILTAKPKKEKKKNYQKQFDPELNMLKTLVADQNRFTTDLQKRFNIAAGPATKDSQLPNKTLVELASVINAGRQNSLGVLREVGNLKKTIADLYMKQKKLDADTSGGGFNTTDIGLMGSNIASSIFGDEQSFVSPPPYSNAPQTSSQQSMSVQTQSSQAAQTPIQIFGEVKVEEFNPDTWDGPQICDANMVNFETIPHEVVVEMNKSTGSTRFKAINTETGQEIPNYPVPTSDISRLKVNENDKTVKGEFDEVYKLEIH